MNNNNARFLAIALLLASPIIAAQEEDPASAFRAAYQQYQELTQAGKRDESLPFAERALALGEQVYGDKHRNTAALTYNYGLNLLEQQQFAAAYEQLQKAVSRYKAVYGEESEELVSVHMDAGLAAARAAQPVDAQREFASALDLVTAIHGEKSETRARFSLDVGTKLLEIARSADAKPYLATSRELFRELGGSQNIGAAAASFYLGKFYLMDDRPDEAEKYFIEALPGFDNDTENGPQLARMTREYLVRVYEGQNRSDAATEHLLAIGRALPPQSAASPQPLYRPEPVYPAQAAKDGKEGHVIVKFDVDAEGYVKNPEAIEVEGDKSFKQAALDAVKGYRYAPRFVDGQAVVAEDVRTQLTFKLGN